MRHERRCDGNRGLSMNDLKSLFLREPRRTLSVAESLTSGHLQVLIGGISGASEFFRGGVTAYTLDQKVRHLGVDRAAAAAVDCVSEEIARQMARGACALFGSDVGVATTGYAEPAPAQGVTTPFACWAIACRKEDNGYQLRSGRVICAGMPRALVQATVARAVLAELRGELK